MYLLDLKNKNPMASWLEPKRKEETRLEREAQSSVAMEPERRETQTPLG